MYEKSGLSPLERLIGREIFSVCFVQNYIQIHFGDLIFTCYSLPILRIADEETDSNAPGYKDKLCSLIGKSVEAATEKARDELSIYFGGDDCLKVSLRFEAATSVEAAMLYEQGGDIFDVWRYE